MLTHTALWCSRGTCCRLVRALNWSSWRATRCVPPSRGGRFAKFSLWLVGWLVEWSVGWLVGWLVGRSAGWLVAHTTHHAGGSSGRREVIVDRVPVANVVVAGLGVDGATFYRSVDRGVSSAVQRRRRAVERPPADAGRFNRPLAGGRTRARDTVLRSREGPQRAWLGQVRPIVFVVVRSFVCSFVRPLVRPALRVHRHPTVRSCSFRRASIRPYRVVVR